MVAVAPLAAVSARFAAIGEFDFFDTDASLMGERLHGPLSESFPEYKLAMTQGVRPALLVLGSSRVMQIRGSFFDRCSSADCFYNAGGAALTIKTAEEFFTQVAKAGAAPRVMLLGLDIWQFNPNDASNTHEATPLTPSVAERLRRSIGLVRQFTPRLETDDDLRSLVAGAVVTPAGYRGARAILRSEGFRPDGSYSYGPRFLSTVAAQSSAERSADAVDRIAKSCCRLERFTSVDTVAVGELEQLLAEARLSGTQVIAFTLPFSDELAEAVERDVALRAGFADVESALTAVLRRNDVPFFRFARLSDVDCRPSEMLDGFHVSEVCAARIIDRLLASDLVARALVPFVDQGRLRTKIGSRSSHLFMPP